MRALDDQIDDLYKGPLGDFTAARNALAKTLTGPNSDDAKRVRALQKPTVVPWTVNQLHWHARKTYDRLLDRGARLRKAQIAALSGKGDGDTLREATDAHRAAIAEAVREAGRIAGVGSQHTEPLMRTLEALSLSADPPEPHGRLTDVLQPAGFEALAGVTPKVRLQPRDVRLKPDTTASGSAVRRQADHKAEAEAAKKREAEIKTAEAAVERARDAETFARKTLDRASRELADAEARLKRTRDRS